MRMGWYILFFEVIGTIAFSISGALVGLQCELDLFGVTVLGVITATGGGIIRDVILGNTPPAAFRDPLYVIVAAVCALLVFGAGYIQAKKHKHFHPAYYDKLLLVMDSVGLGIFTVMGVRLACQISVEPNSFLCIFSGVVSGVGGGMIRDMIVNSLPDIFRKQIYAMASLAGAVVTLVIIHAGDMYLAVWIGTVTIVLIRLLAAYKQWSLPKVPVNKK